MSKLKLVSNEIDMPISAGLSTTFSNAGAVRLVNTNSGPQTVTVLETQNGEEIGSFTMVGNSVETLYKSRENAVYASSADIKGAHVGFVG